MTKVLFVDDEKELAELARCYFLDAGISIDIACSADEALTACKNKDYNIIFSDDRMPGRTGVQLYIELREHGYCGSFILLSAHLGCAELAAGISEAMSKPLDFESLVNRVKQLKPSV